MNIKHRFGKRLVGLNRRPHFPPHTRRALRQPCIGGCGRWVLPILSAECRKCRRQRIHAGRKRVRASLATPV